MQVLFLNFRMDTAQIYAPQTVYSKLQYQCGSYESSLRSEIIRVKKLYNLQIDTNL